MGLVADALRATQNQQGPDPDTIPDALGKGWDSGLDTSGASLNQIAGLVGENLGKGDFAKRRYAEASRLRDLAQAEAPQIQSLGQVHGLRDALTWGAGQLGGMAPVAGAAIGAGLLTQNPLVAGTIAMSPFEMGDIAARQQMDPASAGKSAGLRLRDATLGGVGSAALMNLGPAALAGKIGTQLAEKEAGALAKRGVGEIIGGNLLHGAGTNAGAMAGGEAVKQYAANQEAPLDYGQIGDAGLTGAVMGTAFGAAGAGMDLARQGTPGVKQSINEKLAAKKAEAAAPAPEATPVAAEPTMTDRVGAFLKRGREAVDTSVNDIMNDHPLGAKLSEMGTATADQIKDMFKNSDGQAATKVKEWGEDMLSKMSPDDERVQTIKDAMANAGDVTARKTMAGLKQAWDATESARQHVGDFAKTVSDKYNEFKKRDVDVESTDVTNRIGNDPLTMKSEDQSGTRAAIAEELLPLIKKNRPELLSDTASINELAGSVSKAMELISRGELTDHALSKLTPILGSESIDALARIHERVHGDDPVQTESFFKNLNEMSVAHDRANSIHDLVRRSFTEEAQRTDAPANVHEIVSGLIDHARGHNSLEKPSAKEVYLNKQVGEHMKRLFGDKADAVSKAIEKEAGLGKERDATTGSLDEPAGKEKVKLDAGKGSFDEGGSRVALAAPDRITIGRGKSNAEMVDPDIFKAQKRQGLNHARQALLDAKAKYPDRHVFFERAEGSKEWGHVVAEKVADPHSFNEAEFESMKPSADYNTASNKSRLKVGDTYIDAMKVANVMRKKGYSSFEGPEAVTSRDRLIDAFKQGIAQIIEQKGVENFKIPQDAKIGKVGGKWLTWGEALKGNPEKNAAISLQNAEEAAHNAHIEALRKEYKLAKDPEEKARIKTLADKLITEHEYDKDYELSTSKDDFKDTTDSTKPMKPSKDGQIHETSKDFSGKKADEMINRSNLDGSGHSVSDRTSGTQALDGVANEMLAARPKAAKALGEKIKGLLQPDRWVRISDEDQAALQSILAGPEKGTRKSGAEIAAIVNPLAEKYGTDKPKGQTLKGKTTADGGNEGVPPLPKAVAAKKAAFLERAASGDKALTKELSETGDAKGLQRAINALADHAPESEAMKTATERLTELVKNPDVAYGMQTTKYSLESTNPESTTDGRAKLITRLADQRADRVSKTDAQGKYSRLEGEVSFGPLDRAAVYVSANGEHTHAFIIPRELVSKAEELLAKYPVEREADVLAAMSAQHAFYNRATGEFESFGPDPRSRAGQLLKERGALGDTGEKFQHGQPVTRVEGVTAKQTMSFLADALAYAKHIEGKETIPVSWERMTGGNVGKKGGGNFSAESIDPNINHQSGSRPDIALHIEKVLGKSVKLAWAKLTHAGEYTHAAAQGIIRLSVHALDPMSTAYHESLHAFFGQLRDAGARDITEVLERTAQSSHVLKQLTDIYKNQPEVLKQLRNPEERAAYMYQQWALDPKGFKVSIAAKNIFGRIAQYIRNAVGMWTNDERALHIMEYFHSGEYAKNMSSPSSVRAHLMEVHRSQILETAKSFAEPLAQLADAVTGMGSSRMHDTGVPALKAIADLIKRDQTDGSGKDQGFIQASRIEATKMRTRIAEDLHGYSEEQLHDAMEALQSAQPAATPEAQAAANKIKAFLADSHKYMTDAGVQIGNLGPDYFPRVWDTHYISKNMQAFKDMMEPYVRTGKMKGSVDELVRNLINRSGNEFGIETREPGMQFTKERVLDFIDPKDAAQFVEKDLMGTLNSYLGQAARRAEWNRRMGNGKLEQLWADAQSQGATKEHLEMADDYLKGVDGTLGDNINPTARRLMGNMIVYQNLRLLPMASFSMLIDPLGVMVRGGSVKGAFNTFKRGMGDLKSAWGKDGPTPDEASHFAEMVGTVESAILSHTMGDTYTQGMVGGTAKDLNNAFFKYNLVESLNRSFRIGAAEAAMDFLGVHGNGAASVHSQRWMDELNIKKGDIVMRPDGRIAMSVSEGLTEAQAGRVHAAINQWVDGAILRPDAADKPIWMNNPHFALIAHLKQFVFSFQKTILERTAHEMKHGNYTPAMALASYVPVMMAADMTKGLLLNNGNTPDWQKGWGAEDYIEYGVQRAGLLGVGQFGLDIAKDVERGNTGFFALSGPTIEQLRDGVETAGGHKQFGSTVIDAMPANALYKHSLGEKTDGGPMFAD